MKSFIIALSLVCSTVNAKIESRKPDSIPQESECIQQSQRNFEEAIECFKKISSHQELQLKNLHKNWINKNVSIKDMKRTEINDWEKHRISLCSIFDYEGGDGWGAQLAQLKCQTSFQKSRIFDLNQFLKN